MRRAPIVVAATVAGFAGVLSFHTKGTTIAISGTTGTPAAGTGTTGSSSSSGGSSATGTTGSSGSPSGSSGSPSSSPSSSSSGATSTTVPAPTGVRTATGTNEQFGYGAMAVKVTVNGSKITDVSVASIQTAEPTSAQICSEVIPMLRQEVMRAQSARINGISGATYTSEAYAYSLQAALDKLHVK